jgi:putative N-acetylmannosamine-6-phosphate epimerase
MIRKNQWDNVYIVQASLGLNSRSEAVPFYAQDSITPDSLPLFVAPMDTTISLKNYKEFTDANLNVCIPRMKDDIFNVIEKHNDESIYYSVSLSQFEKLIDKDKAPKYRILIDVANGNMPRLHDMIHRAKEKFGDNIIIMAGNVGSVRAFETLQTAGADLIRVGIGSGSACNTTIHTGVFQHLPSLIQECKRYQTTAKIVADGGFKIYSEIIKALACGADYVMCGGIFNKCLESCGEKFVKAEEHDIYMPTDNSQYSLQEIMEMNQLYVQYRGMSTREVQREWGKENLRHSEGKSFYNKVEYTLNEWLYGSDSLPDDYPGFVNVLKSTMSYTGSQNIEAFILKNHINYL